MTKAENSDFEPSLRVVALGGLNEIGKNLWVYEAVSGSTEKDSEYLVVDAGLVYPGQEEPSVDYIMPEFKYLIDKSDRIKALVLTSAHERHSGCATHLIQKCGIKKVIGSKLAIEFLKSRLGEELAAKIQFEEFESRKTVKVSKFKVTPFTITSNSHESYAVMLEAHNQKVFYTGSYKIDQTPTNGVKSDIPGIVAHSIPDDDSWGEIDLMLSDSANIETEGYSKSEMALLPNIRKILKGEPGRVIFNTYNSNTVRLQNLFRLAEECGRKVALLNKDVKEVYKALRTAGVLDNNEEHLVSMRDTDKLPDDEVLVLCTAPQGDALRELVTLAKDENLEMQLKEGDVVVNSADPPPGTVRVMAQTADAFFLKNVKIIGGRNAGVHAETHALSEEMKFMFNVVRPHYFAPAIGDTRHLVRHGKLAVEVGFDPTKIFILNNGDVFELNQSEGLQVVGNVSTDEIKFNHYQDYDIDDKIVKERDLLSMEGVVTIALSINKQGRIVSGPAFSAKACTFSKNKEWRAFCMINTQELVDSVHQMSMDKPKASIEDYQKLIHEYMSGLIKKQIGKKPSVSVIVNQI